MKKFIILLVLIFMSCAPSMVTAKKNKAPDWVMNPQSKYKDAYYLSAVGSGDTKKSAEKDAYSNLSKIFQADIKSDETLTQKFEETTVGDKTSLTAEEKMRNLTQIQSEQTLKNVKIGDSYFDPNSGEYYVIAYLNRSETEDIYHSEIMQNTQKIDQYYSQYEGGTSKLDKLKYLSNAIELAEQNEILNAQLRIISPSHAGIELKQPLEKLVAERNTFAKTIHVIVIGSGKYNDYLEDYLKEVFNNFGFMVYASAADADYIDFRIESSLSISKIDLDRDEKFVRWELSITILDKVSNAEAVLYTKSDREGHLNLTEAQNRALRTVKTTIQKDFFKFFANKYLS
ncbi:MAG TPA: hypothetical protein ENL10_00555 [Candidatus Cloacimonetes bacterium]|nr:LPP20 family lipoprotein [Candidatus Cloacimonadota bacterium]HHE39978.1 hypothetical protein [Candidatus Cloacimonadota bacterium]